MKRVLLLIIAVCFTVFSFAQDAADKINQANEALKGKIMPKLLLIYTKSSRLNQTVLELTTT